MKMHMNKNKIISNIFILVLYYILIHNSYIRLNHHKNEDNKKDKIYIDWEKAYPFYNKIKKHQEKYNYIELLNNKLKNRNTHSENRFRRYLPFKYKICEIQMAFEKLFGVRLFLKYDGLVVLNNDYLDFWASPSDALYPSKRISEFSDYIKQLNSNFVLVIYPIKNSKYDNQLPIGLKDNINTTVDNLLNILEGKKINTLDLRENVKNTFKSHYEMFFLTDHHWKPSAGLWASKEICKYINEKYNWNIKTSLLDKENFNTTILPNYYLGSQGKKITLTYVKPDDFIILEPRYKTDFQRFCPEWQNATGTFADVMFSKKHIEKCDLYNENTYSYYLDGDKGYLRLINNSDYAFNKKVLLIRDSFNCVVSPFLALGIKDLTMLDLRYFNGSLKTFIEKENFDLVIIGYNAHVFSGQSKLLDFD